MNEITTGILEQASECFNNVRQNLLAGAALLHKISTEKLYEGRYSSFEEYVNEECQIKPSFASKLITVHEYWVVQNSLSQEKLQGIDVEKLYLARKLDGEPQTQLVKAQTLSRDDIRAELLEESGTDFRTCEHTWCTFCTKCRSKKA